ncbi:MAG: hypothetical protein DRJ46_01500 [Thermoprotei archaeon]|nr:MAG: hypothetical protein DRJ46_01500 [Thermoprotei archaeon]
MPTNLEKLELEAFMLRSNILAMKKRVQELGVLVKSLEELLQTLDFRCEELLKKFEEARMAKGSD